MGTCSTFRAGGMAAAVADVEDMAELDALLKFCRSRAIDWRIIGRGSNILVSAGGYKGVIVRLRGEFSKIEKDNGSGGAVNKKITVGGGCSLSVVLSWCSREGLGGLEFLSGIPGSMGGALRMNAGAFDHELGDLVESVILILPNGEVIKKQAKDFWVGYRSFTVEGFCMEQVVIVSISLSLKDNDPDKINSAMLKYRELRRGKQPQAVASAGSFFKNPQGDYAGRLIEMTGMKSYQVGGAMVSPVHANFIVNVDGGATAADILELSTIVQGKVEAKTGILLEPEVHVL
jgi:UDP-N-acetylmuramate dehydrogenase